MLQFIFIRKESLAIHKLGAVNLVFFLPQNIWKCGRRISLICHHTGSMVVSKTVNIKRVIKYRENKELHRWMLWCSVEVVNHHDNTHRGWCSGAQPMDAPPQPQASILSLTTWLGHVHVIRVKEGTEGRAYDRDEGEHKLMLHCCCLAP